MDTPAACRTLYVRNLPHKLNKKRLQHLLHAAFSPHGRVVWIVAERTIKLRGQAFVTFETQTSATTAMRAMHASEFMGRQIVVTYSKTLSDRAGGKKLGGDSELSRKERSKKRKEEQEAKVEQENKKMKMDIAQGEEPQPENAPVPGHAPIAVPSPVPHVVPNRILFIENLPENISVKDGNSQSIAEGLTTLFAPFAGFVEVRTVPGKSSIAFVEFESEAESAIALGGLQGHEIGTPPQQIKLSFAKK